MDSHQITPHKGGRSERLFVRITPELKDKAERIAKERDISIADLIAELLEAAQ